MTGELYQVTECCRSPLDVTAINYKVPGRAQDGAGNEAMSATSGHRKIELEKLRARRNQLFELFAKHPNDFPISLEIKKLDDQIAELTEREEPRKGTKG